MACAAWRPGLAALEAPCPWGGCHCLQPPPSPPLVWKPPIRPLRHSADVTNATGLLPSRSTGAAGVTCPFTCLSLPVDGGRALSTIPPALLQRQVHLTQERKLPMNKWAREGKTKWDAHVGVYGQLMGRHEISCSQVLSIAQFLSWEHACLTPCISGGDLPSQG